MKVGVSGATGFVGRRLIGMLRQAGATPLSLMRSPTSAPDTHAIGDLAEEGPLDLPAMDALVHLAGRVHVMEERASDPLAAYRRVNVMGTQRLLEGAVRAGARRFVFVSTIKVLGEETLPGAPFTQASRPNPQDPYSVSKLEAEELVARICQHEGMEWAIVRPVLVYGPGVGGNFVQLLRLVDRQWPLPFGSIDNRRSLLFVDNLCAFLWETVRRPELAGRIVNLADEPAPSTPDLIRALGEAMGKRVRLLPVPVQLLELGARMAGRGETMRRLTRSLQVDTADLFREMRWQQPTSWKAALQETTADAFRLD